MAPTATERNEADPFRAVKDTVEVVREAPGGAP
jgi:hypothetical protein